MKYLDYNDPCLKSAEYLLSTPMPHPIKTLLISLAHNLSYKSTIIIHFISIFEKSLFLKTKMKIGAGLIALVAAGTPPPVSETCPHCVAFDQATQDFMQGTQGNIANSWLNLVNEACMTSPPNQQTACQLIMDIGFTNVLNNMLTMDPNAWCADLTFCKGKINNYNLYEFIYSWNTDCPRSVFMIC